MTRLLVTRDEAKQKLINRINTGIEIWNRSIQSENDLEKARKDRQKWSNYNSTLLKTLFDDNTFSDEYAPSRIGVSFSNQTWHEKVEEFNRGTSRYILILESILERLELIPEHTNSPAPNKAILGNKVFIVHGHDEAARESVARFIDKLGLESIILHERPNLGRTIIEKFEQEAADIGFSIVLLTPDDFVTSGNAQDDPKNRARQNVIFELGYFMGKLGRQRVALMYKGVLELPSDIFGVVYVPMDSNDGWRLKLARELKAADFDIDLNKAI